MLNDYQRICRKDLTVLLDKHKLFLILLRLTGMATSLILTLNLAAMSTMRWILFSLVA
jgi:hypothetical protein